jgi:hypothetical protein
MHVYVTTCVARRPSIVPPTIVALSCSSIAEWRHWCQEGSEVEMFVLPSSSDTHNLYKTSLPLDPRRIPNPQALFLSLKCFLITLCKVLTFTHKSHLRSQALFLSFETLLIAFAHNPISLITLYIVISPSTQSQAVLLSHLISEEEPSASHMCARISSHTYDRQKWVKYHKQYLNVFQSLTTYYTHAGDSKVSNNEKR